ncbi:MAG: indolepyruvate ferredoxin oxidoreductase subunit alpha [Deltaproteobacteria bacterium RBG_16_64_85]|nr:MAG: indolepyruvate ferredoxin oxidoreductase subunit alpha [Deltaproteobacteria bacterium RBG_16_64_85]
MSVPARQLIKLLSGNEAIARGAFEAGVKVASAYPGTPSTEILENLARYEGVYAEWAPNEKVAVEVALGASMAGARALAAMKHVGVNVAADPIFTASYTGVRGGFVIVTADDPEMHSSQNEQDNRHYAVAAKIPMLEPSDSEEAKEFTRIAFALSEEFDTPVFLRTTTRISHAKGTVRLGEVAGAAFPPGFVRDTSKWVMLPQNARARHVLVEERMRALAEFAETFPGNRIEWGDRSLGVITAGVSYQYVREAFPDASVLKLGMAHPLPSRLIREFAAGVTRLVVVEELDPHIETHVKALGIPVQGKERIPLVGELDPRIVREGIAGGSAPVHPREEVPSRPPNLCPGCPHRGLFYVLTKLKVIVAGDIGCYTLAALPPLGGMDTCVCMGASIGNAFGIEKALGKAALGKVVAVIGDSTFIHSGITGLIDIVYNRGFTTVIILDNRTTAMTGAQENPATGRTLMEDPTHRLDLPGLCRAIGVEHVYTVNPHDMAQTEAVLRRELSREAPSVVITEAPCVLLPEHRKKKRPVYEVIPDLCTGCKACGKLGCPAIEWVPFTTKEAVAAGKKAAQKGMSRIHPLLCDGCNQCPPLCKFKAILEKKD